MKVLNKQNKPWRRFRSQISVKAKKTWWLLPLLNNNEPAKYFKENLYKANQSNLISYFIGKP